MANVKYESFGAWKEFDLPITIGQLLQYRDICKTEFEAYRKREENSVDQGRLGFTPVTFTNFFLDKHGIRLPNNVDMMLTVYALYQKIQYEDVNGKWIKVPLLYKW
jgi:hypothetical protein